MAALDAAPVLTAAGRITAIEPDARRAGAVRVAIEGRVVCTVPAEAVKRAGLTVGTTVDDVGRAALERGADEEAAFRTALRALERRAFARRDLGRRLVKRGHPLGAVEGALARLDGAGLLDDAAYAANYVQTRSLKGRGPARLRRDLRAMGVEGEVIDRALGAHFPAGADLGELVLPLARKRASQLGTLPRPVKRRRLLGYLARRGFVGRAITELVERVLAPGA